MAKLLYSATMSLDGFIAGPGGDMSWLTEHFVGDGGESATVARLLADVGALLVGHNTFGGDDPNRGTDKEGAFGGQYQGPVVVLTHPRPPTRPRTSRSAPTCRPPSTKPRRPRATST
jgi:riboflavin biosynthesis pyrimidine reductase